MKEKAFQELHMELCWNIVKGGKKMDYINAFWVGGLDLCTGADPA